MSLKKKHRAEYCALINAIHRCHNPNHVAYKHYGERGIQVCDEWRVAETGFAAFLNHIGPRPDASYSLDRIDNDSHYEPGNVRWTDKTTQGNNRRPFSQPVADYGWGIGFSMPMPFRGGERRYVSAYLPHDGRKQTVVDWSNELKIKSATIRQRLERGLSPEEALCPKLHTGRRRTQALPTSELPVPAPELDDPDVALVREVGSAIDVLSKAIEEFKGRMR